MTSLIQLTQDLFLQNASLLAQVDYSYTTEGNPPGTALLDLLAGISHSDDRGSVEDFHQGWTARLGRHHSDREYYFLCKVAGRPGWWVILMLLPIVNFIVWIILCIDVAKNFGKGAGFGIGLLLLPIIFFPILGFGNAQYQGTAATPKI